MSSNTKAGEPKWVPLTGSESQRTVLPPKTADTRTVLPPSSEKTDSTDVLIECEQIFLLFLFCFMFCLLIVVGHLFAMIFLLFIYV